MKIILTAAILLVGAIVGVAHEASAQNGAAQSEAQKATQSMSAPTALEPAAAGEPHTEMLDTANSPAGYDPLLEPKPLPKANLSLIGGIARKVDKVHSRVTVQPFGGGKRYLIYMDDRTRILSGGRETTILAIHPGERIYADTQTLGAQVFARTIEVGKVGAAAQASGQVISIAAGQVHLQDRLSGTTIQFAISDRTKVEARGAAVAAAQVHAGSLIDVTFMPGGRRDAQSITIHASPGESYAFAGRLTHVDLRDGLLALDDQADGNNYEVYFDPLKERNVRRLVVGVPVSVTASFDGKSYRVKSIKINEAAASDR